jgi:aspartyl-tRNA(Asn)/glutamyl-tRNA(Gln) amidotransferase subunit A
LKLYELTIHELKDLIDEKKVTAVEITKSIFDRIKKVENKIESYITLIEERAIKEAEDIDKEINNGEIKGNLVGIPMAIKDNICTKNILTTCASNMLSDFKPPYDAFVIEKLKQAGTIMIGKLNMDEFAMGSSTENSYFKKTKNPYNLERVPGGSSGGSAAAVAADEAIFTLGSDTGGSIRQPAAFCGVVGIKPTYGTVSRYGLIAFASSLDQIGSITKDVTDCALVLNSIAGYDNRDSTSVKREYPNFTEALINNIKGLKIGIPEEYFKEGINQEVKSTVLKAIETMAKLGAEYKNFSLPAADYALPAYYLLSSAEASSNLARYDGVKYGYRAKEYEDLQELYIKSRSEGFGEEVKRRIMLGTYALSSGHYDAYYKKAQQVRTVVKEKFDEAFEKYDIIATPVAPTTAFNFGEKSSDPLQMYLGDICTISANIAGLPAITIPCGFDNDGMPIGLQLIAREFDEETLLRAAFTFEQNTGYHKVRPKIK